MYIKYENIDLTVGKCKTYIVCLILKLPGANKLLY